MTGSLRFTNYRIVSRLGAGGMGEVHLAEDLRLYRKCALKILSPDFARDPAHLARFVQEARAASAFNHPNVAHIYEIGAENGVHFLAMEYVEGRTLEALLAEKPLPLTVVLSAAMEAADALDTAHSRGIVHRDIKPANLMMDERGHLKMLDFGLAKMARDAAPSDETQFLSDPGRLLGTVAYMSPEQALGQTVDGRSDLFSLGVVLYRALAGRPPFPGQNSQETLAHILQSQPEPLARFCNDVPPEFERIVRKCLEKDRERRYASARDLLVDLRGVSANHGVPAEVKPATLRAVIVDDEELARQLLAEYLRAGRGVEVVAECGNGFEAVKAVSEHKPDVVFLDIQMPKLDGFEVLELIDTGVAVIFVTAYDQYAMRAFDAHAVDYLLKPFAEDRLWKAVERARERLGRSGGSPHIAAKTVSLDRSALVRDARPPGEHLSRIVVRDGTKVQIIPAAKLDYVEAQDDYIALHSEKKQYLKQQTISSIEEQLDPKMFVRVHRSYIVNLERVARIEPYAKDSKVAVLTNGAQIPVSKAGHARLKVLLGEAG